MGCDRCGAALDISRKTWYVCGTESVPTCPYAANLEHHMLASLIQWLDRVGPLVFWTCFTAIVVVDTAAVAAVMTTKSRALVNRWTGAVLAVNAFLLGAGVGIPATMYAAKMAVSAFAPSSMVMFAKDADATANPLGR
jgi:hypothetical protein